MQKTSQSRQIQFQANTFKLGNGLTVIHQHLPATNVVVSDIWVKAGAIAEPESWSGMAHFLEHMIFKGSPNVMVGEFDWLVESTGGVTNAATSYDYAHFYLTTAVAHVEQTLPSLADILLRAHIADDEFIREREVVLEEILASYNDPDYLGYQALCQNTYHHHPYGRSILGEKESLLEQTPNQMRCFHRTYYQPENMTIVIVGGMEQEQALALVHDNFSGFSVRSECPPVKIEAEPPITSMRRQELYLPRIEQARLLMAWICPGSESLREAIALDLIALILAGGRSSGLVRELREERQLVLDIDCSLSLQRDSSMFSIGALLDLEHVSMVESMISDRLEQLHHNLIPQAEVASAQRQLINDYIFSTETPSQLASVYGFYNIIATAEHSVLYPQIVSQLEPEELREIAQRYLSPECYAVTILKPGCNN
ncbi:MAG: pitrilysin family protein [Cyanobacteria bacterium P01_C01_bin.72]